MKKTVKTLLAAVMMLSLGACSSDAGNTETDTTDAETVLVKVNTYGPGRIEVSEDGTEPEFGELPFQSYVANVEAGSELIIITKGEEGWKFVKWTNNGEDYSTEEKLHFTAEEDADLVAVYLMDTGYEGKPVDDISQVKTMADVLALPSYGSSFSGDRCIFAFELNGIIYQAIADLDEATARTMFDLAFDDPEYQKKYNEMRAPLEVTKIVNLSEMVPSQEELDAMTGKTFAELLDQDWVCTGWNFEEKVAYLEHGPFTYEAGFEGDYDPDSFDESTLAKLTVSSVKYTGIGDVGWTE